MNANGKHSRKPIGPPWHQPISHAQWIAGTCCAAALALARPGGTLPCVRLALVLTSRNNVLPSQSRLEINS